MKICPRCHTKYDDDNLNYCLDDGVQLTSSPTIDTSETLPMGIPRPTVSPSPEGQFTPPSAWQPAGQQLAQPAQRSSKGWIWAVAILALVVLLCGGGLVGLAVFKKQIFSSASNTSRTSPSRTPAATPSSSPSASPAGPALTKAKADQIEIGMPKADVQRILGSEGELFNSTSGGGITFENYKWTDANYAYVIITFRDGKVMSMSKGGFKE